MTESKATYRAVHAVRPGRLELTEKRRQEPGAGYARLVVEACGVCHSDGATVEGALPIAWPRVPGHEVVGIIDAVGPGRTRWKVGQRVGVGFLGGSCGECQECRGGDLVSCPNQEFTGVQTDGGYAEQMIVKQTGLMEIPAGMSSVAAAPLLCAGLTTFSALVNSGAKPGELVAILGIGGLGHLGVQYARKMGFEVVAIGRSADENGIAERLGAHHYIDSSKSDPAEALQRLGGARLVVATASGGKAVDAVIKGLRPRGEVLVLGASPEPIQASSTDLLFASRGMRGALTGDPATGDATLRFSKLTGVEAMIETLPLERAAEGYAKMMAGKAHFRIVVTTGERLS